MKLTTSGYDENGMRIVEMAESISNFLAQYDVTSTLPWDIYRQLPIEPSREVNTLAGIQSLNVYSGDVYKRFFRPSKESQIYDIDKLKNYFWDKSGILDPFVDEEELSLWQRLQYKKDQKSKAKYVRQLKHITSEMSRLGE